MRSGRGKWHIEETQIIMNEKIDEYPQLAKGEIFIKWMKDFEEITFLESILKEENMIL